MATLDCKFDAKSLSYILKFQSKHRSFNARYNIICPNNFEYKPISCYDGFIFAVIFAAMESGEDLHTDLPISLIGLRNMYYFIEAWNNLMPDKYKKIQLIANNTVNDISSSKQNDEAISAFSGGVDACFTLLRHNKKDWNNNSFHIKNVLCVQGFDVPTNKNKEYELLTERISPIYEQFNCKQFKVWTDIKENSKQDWEMSFSAQLASCLHLFSEHFSNAIIGSSESYKDFILPWGSTPATDFLLSSESMTIHHDGAGYTRTEKVERIANNKLISQNLKVCWEAGLDRNCGKCEKCYRTRLNFMATGHKNPLCFDAPYNELTFKKIRYTTKTSLIELQSILDYSNKNLINDKWYYAIKRKIFISKILNFSPFLFLRKIKLKLIKKFNLKNADQKY